MRPSDFNTDPVGAIWRRIDSCQEDIVDQAELLRSMNDRLLGELIMSDPTYVLSLEQREAALSSQPDRAVPEPTHSTHGNPRTTDSPNHGEG